METLVKGTAIVVGANIDTDVIIPARYLVTHDPAELARHCLESAVPDLAARVARGATVLVAGPNFGSGSSREHAPIAIRAAGVRVVVAPTFARIFFRNAFNIGLPLVECAGVDALVGDGDEVEVDLAAGRVTHRPSGTVLTAAPMPPFMRELVEAGGLVPYVRRALGKA
jgi:3-isopropylmalate dehydratase small subunit